MSHYGYPQGQAWSQANQAPQQYPNGNYNQYNYSASQGTDLGQQSLYPPDHGLLAVPPTNGYVYESSSHVQPAHTTQYGPGPQSAYQSPPPIYPPRAPYAQVPPPPQSQSYPYPDFNPPPPRFLHDDQSYNLRSSSSYFNSPYMQPPLQGYNSNGATSFNGRQSPNRKKALLIGINYSDRYPGRVADKYGFKALRGCVNDVNDIWVLLIEQYKYDPRDIVLMTDVFGAIQPTKENIEREMHQLVSGAQPGDTLFFQFSGHGWQTKAAKKDELDDMDEIILPVDFDIDQKKWVIDNDMHQIMVSNLPRGGTTKEPRFKRFKRHSVIAAENAKQTKTAQAEVIMFSGSKDSQDAKEVLIHGQYKGALTWAFLEALRKNVLNGNSNPSYIRLLADLRAELETSKYRNIWKTLPKPQLSSSHKMDVSNLQFMI
ncbi:MAG: Ca(2+)-dependent cysteine protease [Icmadophila ericetorum]|nr:Ca(2+)-dependent cysteine protease [Icmadophila ericetorum]